MMMTTTGPSADLPVGLQAMELEDGVKAAKRTVAYWEGELVRRIEAAQAFDGMGGWMSRLMGSYEQDVDAAVRDVALARAQLAHAKEQVAEADEQLRVWREQQVQKADDAVAQVMAVEEAVARARAAGGPAAVALQPIEARLALVEARQGRLNHAHEASLDLVMELSRARAAATRSRPHTEQDYAVIGGGKYGGHSAVPIKRVEGEYKEVEIGSVSEVAMAWEEAMLALGVDAPPGVELAMDALLQVDGVYGNPDDSELLTMRAQAAVEPMVPRLKDVLDEVRAEVAGLMQQRAQAVGMEL